MKPKTLTTVLFLMVACLLISGCQTEPAYIWRPYVHLLLGGIVLTIAFLTMALSSRSRCLKSVPIRQDTSDARRS